MSNNLASEPVLPAVETPLHALHGLPSGADGAVAGLRIVEASQRSFLSLRGNAGNAAFCQHVESVIGLPLPVVPGHWVSDAHVALYWQGPDEWLVVAGDGNQAPLIAGLREGSEERMAVVDVSGGLTLLHLEGAGVDTVLKKASSYDFDSRVFGVGRCVQTHFAKAGALVARRPSGSVDLIIRRSFADYLGRWLLDAGREFSAVIAGER